MARPPRQDAAEMRGQILAIARRNVLAGGPGALSLRGIARELGYSPGSLYRYFDGRDAILRALREAATATMNARLATAAADNPDEHPLVAMGMTYVRTCREYPEDPVLAGLLRSRTSLSQPVPTHSPYRLVLAAFAEAAARGEFGARCRLDPQALEQMAYGLWALVQGMVDLQRTHLRGFDADFDTADRKALRALLRGYGMRDASAARKDSTR